MDHHKSGESGNYLQVLIFSPHKSDIENQIRNVFIQMHFLESRIELDFSIHNALTFLHIIEEHTFHLFGSSVANFLLDEIVLAWFSTFLPWLRNHSWVFQ